MRYVVTLLVSICLLGFVPAWAPAQTSSWDPILASFGFDIDVAYVGYTKGATLDVTSDTGDNFALGAFLRGARQTYGLSGVQTALSLYATTGKVTTKLVGTWVFPSVKQSAQTDLVGVPGFAGADVGRSWQTSTQWWTLDGSASTALYGGTSVVAGLRYDNFATAFLSPSDYTGLPAVVVGFFGQPTDKAGLAVQAWIPYVGLVADYSSVRAGVTLAPWVFGSFAYGESVAVTGLNTNWFGGAGGFTKGSWFTELFAEWGTKIPGGYGSVSLYGKYSYLQGSSNVSVSWLPGVVPWPGVATGTESTFKASFIRGNYLLGGKFVFDFNIPL